IDAAVAVSPGARSSSWFTTGHNPAYVSKDGHTTFAEIYPTGQPEFSTTVKIKETRAKLRDTAPAGVETHLTGRDALYDEEGSSGGPSVILEAFIGSVGALVILLFVFGTLPAMLMPLAVALASILNTFTLVWALTYITDVSLVVEFLIALVGLGVA